MIVARIQDVVGIRNFYSIAIGAAIAKVEVQRAKLARLMENTLFKNINNNNNNNKMKKK